MSIRDSSKETVITSYAQAPARTVSAGGITYAYRELGPKGGIPVVFFVHLAATLDNCEFEVREAEALMRQEGIPYLDATSKSVEELATTIVQEAKLVRRIY